jgi:L-aspartate oxidase
MAGNSLTEAVVFGRRAATTMTDEAEPTAIPVVDEAEETGVRTIGADDWAKLRHAMSSGAGLVRTKHSLEQALRALASVGGSSSVRAAATAGTLICRSALERVESRGVHFRSDHPARDGAWDERHVTLRRKET